VDRSKALTQWNPLRSVGPAPGLVRAGRGGAKDSTYVLVRELSDLDFDAAVERVTPLLAKEVEARLERVLARRP
jgi:hypothetical protein